jgi:hypothetical protein
MTETNKVIGQGRSPKGLSALFPGELVSITPLVSFRIAFGLLMLLSMLRFMWRGWVDSVYVHPKFHFTYMGFDWVHPMGHTGMWVLFIALALSTLFITLGLFYRAAIIFFFVGFTYVELLEVTTYLNHYYFISLIAFIMIWLPANRHYSIDSFINPKIAVTHVNSFNINILRFQMGIVYFFAGIAKLNPDWLIEAIPMRIWLPAKSHLPLVGPLMYETWVAYLFSWFGAVYDLSIPFLLANRKTRPYAYVFVIIFHVATAIFFPMIGVFPYVMMVCSLIFFSSDFHSLALSYLPFYNRQKAAIRGINYIFPYQKIAGVAVAIFVALQVLLPFRYLLYPGHLFWHEEGFRFSWRVMLMEKSGQTYFTVKDPATGNRSEVNNAQYLTPFQEKMMSTQPDLILRYAHYLAADYRQKGLKDPEVYAEVYVSLNGDRSKLFTDTTVNLAAQNLSWKHYNWIKPYNKK